MDEKILIALISAITSILVVFIFKPIADSGFHLFKLKQDYKSEQRRKVKVALAENKGKLLKSAEELNHRLWNFQENVSYNWHYVNGNYRIENYYIQSFVYRILSFYANIKILEDKLIFFDGTVATSKDMQMIKFFRLFQECFCDLFLFENIEYNKNIAKDHLFKGQLDNTIDAMIHNGQIISFSEFQNKTVIDKSFDYMFCFIDSISPNENRLRWGRIAIIHLTTIAFLNSFGYDFQYTNKTKIKKLFILYTQNSNLEIFTTIINNFRNILSRYKMKDQPEFKYILNSFH